mgnify:CR=1 FL=1
MKRYILIVTGVLFLFSTASAQNEFDALRYSQNFLFGTARSMGLGGAIGAVGGDFTSLSVNPAGIGLYRKSELTFTPSFNWNNTTSDFFENKYSETRYNLNFGNIGFVANNNINQDKGWISTNFGIGYNQLNNFSAKILMDGKSNSTSLLDNFVYFANQNPNDLDPYYEQLAWDATLLPFDTIDQVYWNDIQNDGYGQNMNREVKRKGGIGEYLLSFGANYSHKLYLGASIGIRRVRYEENVIHTETDVDDNIEYFRAFDFYEDLFTRGTGYTFKIGAIARPIPFLRIGASYHLPTFYYLRDERVTDFYGYIDSEHGADPEPQSSPFNEFRDRKSVV